MLMPHSITDGDACFAYFNKKWGIPLYPRRWLYPWRWLYPRRWLYSWRWLCPREWLYPRGCC